MIKDIFSHKIAIFIYGIVIVFPISYMVVNDIHKERINKQKYEIQTIKSEKALILEEKGNLKEEIKILREKYKVCEAKLSRKIVLNNDEKFSANSVDVTSLVFRIANLINVCRESTGGMKVKLEEYKEIILIIRETFPNDDMLKDAQLTQDYVPAPWTEYYEEKLHQALGNIETHLVLILNYIKEKNTFN